MSNQDQWSREARTIALDHLKQGLKPQIIQQELVEDIPCLSISRSRYVNIILRNRSIENLLYQQGYNRSKEFGMLVQIDAPYNTVWACKGELDHISTDETYKNIVKNSGYRRLVFIHNHPNSQALQVRDMLQLLQTAQIEAVIAVGNSCDRSFAMIKNNDFNEINTLKVLNEIRLICGNINKMGSLRKRIAMILILSNLDTIGLDYITNNWWEV